MNRIEHTVGILVTETRVVRMLNGDEVIAHPVVNGNRKKLAAHSFERPFQDFWVQDSRYRVPRWDCVIYESLGGGTGTLLLVRV